MRRCIIHIGLHKTASTSLQRMLCENRDLLLENGLYFPKTATEGLRFGHHTLAAELNDALTPMGSGPLFRDLAAEIETEGLPETIVLTSEDFSRYIHRAQPVRRLKRWFRRLGYRVETVAYIRPQHTAIHSMYTQRLKMLGLRDTFDAFWPRMMRNVRYDYDRRFRTLFAMPGVRARLFPFNAQTLSQNIHMHFLGTLGVAPDRLKALHIPADRNVAPGPRTIAALSAIGQLLDTRNVKVDHQDVEWIGRFIRRTATERGWDAERYNALTPQILATISTHLSAANERFSQRAFGRPWTDVFTSELAGVPPLNVYRPEDAAPEDREAFEDFVHSAADAIVRFQESGEGLEAAQ